MMMRRERESESATTSRKGDGDGIARYSIARVCAVVGVSALVGGALSSVYWSTDGRDLGAGREARGRTRMRGMRSEIAFLGDVAYDPAMFVDEAQRREFTTRQQAPLRTRVAVLVNEFDAKDLEVGKNTAASLVEKFMKFRHMSKDGLEQFVRFERAVVPVQWPRTLDVALEAVAFMKLNSTNDAPWIGVANRVEKTASQHVPSDWAQYPMHHHLGCMYSHLHLWHTVKRDNLEKMVILESDGAFRTSIDLIDLPNVIDHLPADFDVLFLKDNHKCPGQFVKQFKSTALGQNTTQLSTIRGSLNMIYMYKMNKKCGFSGFESYIISSKGVDKIRDFIFKKQGLDMIDAFVGNYLCKAKRPDHVINCYTASTVRVEKNEMGGFLPEWYGDERIEKEVDPAVVDRFDRDYGAFNREACARPGNAFKGFLPVAYTDAEPNTVFACASEERARSIDVCHADTKLPLLPQQGGVLAHALLAAQS